MKTKAPEKSQVSLFSSPMLYALFFLWIIILFSVTAGRAKIVDCVYAVVEEEAITKLEFEQGLRSVLSQKARQKQSGQFTQKEIEKYKSEVLENMIQNLVVRQEAEKENIEIPDQQVQEEAQKLLERVKKNFKSPEEFNRAIASEFVTEQDLLKTFSNDAKGKMLSSALMEKVVRPQVTISNQALQKYYNKQKIEVTARHILVEKKELSEEIRKRILSGESFDSMAIQFSLDPGSAIQGGKLPPFHSGEMVKPFEDAAMTLELGAISQPVKSQFGYHIIQVIERKTVKPPPLEGKYLIQLRNKLYGRLLGEAFQKYLKRIRAQAYVKVLADNC